MNEDLTTWKKLLEIELKKHGESFDDIVANTMSKKDMNVKFDSGFGGTEGCPFTVWTEKRVYFPVEYDGSEYVASVSRNPDGIATGHIGG